MVCGGELIWAMNFLIMVALNAWKPKIPPNTTATAISMISMRLIIDGALRMRGVRSVDRRQSCDRFFDRGPFRAQRIGDDVDAVPPAAAERLEQRNSVGEARRLGLPPGEPG